MGQLVALKLIVKRGKTVSKLHSLRQEIPIFRIHYSRRAARQTQRPLGPERQDALVSFQRPDCGRTRLVARFGTHPEAAAVRSRRGLAHRGADAGNSFELVTPQKSFVICAVTLQNFV
jgi:hypothetical protein